MRIAFAAVDRLLSRFSRWQIVVIASCAVATIGALDYATGYEVSISVFYLVPVAVASWYAGRGASVGIATLACISWFAADVGAGHPYELLAIPFWNALIRLGFFLVNGLLVVALRDSLLHQRQLARTDALTALFSRRAFEERLAHDLELSRRSKSPLTLAYVDLDDFKALNDRRGHVVGDQALRATALALKRGTRQADTVARLGGDEFALVLPDTGRRGAEELVAKLRHDLGQALGSVAPGLTCSIGVVTFQAAAPRLEEAVRAADELMYQAKRDGKNKVAFNVVAEGAREAVSPRAAGDLG